ncbi:MAG: GWxTD domain-containing protein [Calditrichaeota bacterium]|nr:GWxTD domain-containing protein [Calditrichota bacterium]
MFRFLSAILMLSALLAWPVFAQVGPGMPEWLPEVQVDIADHFTDGNSIPEVVFTCLIRSSDLQFRRTGDGPAMLKADRDRDGNTPVYSALYEISLEIFQDERPVVSRYGRWHAGAEAYRETNRRDDLRWHRFEMDLEPGEYHWWVEFQDLNTRRSRRLEGNFTVDSPPDGWNLSRLWRSVQADSTTASPLDLEPIGPDELDEEHNQFSVYYQVLTDRDRTLTLDSRVEDRRGKARHEKSVQRSYGSGVSHNQFRIPLDKLGAGEYRLVLSLSDSTHTLTRSVDFNVRWRNVPQTVDDLESAIAQLRYIAPRKELKLIQNARPPHNQTLFDRFWQRYDPDPESEENELKREYYERVGISNNSFSWARFPGWKSDRGRVYILYGEPSVRERFESTFDQPALERWVYHESDRSFVFVDEYGFGEFRLVPDAQLSH